MRAILFSDRAVVRVTGEDAPRFLNGIVTNAVEDLAPGAAVFTALLTPQGKIVVDFHAVAVAADEGGGFVLDAPSALADELVRKLGFYKLRAKVEIVARPDLAVAVVLDHEPVEELGLVYLDPRQAGLGWRVVLPAEGAAQALARAGAKLVGADAWQGRRISLGIPEGGKDFIYGDTFPHEADMDLLGGVDFHKGCFIGQEVVSRVERRDVARKRVVPVAFADAAPSPGIEVTAGERTVGFMGSAAGRLGLALLRLDRVDEAMKEGGKLVAGGVELQLVKPDWANFPFPGEKASV
ncbi:MAG: folate-binding protein [Xanthobacteraceae bacterium]